MNAISILEEQLRLLRIEREEDLRLYSENVLKRSLKERVEKGVTWYPMEIMRSYIGTAGMVSVELTRKPEQKGDFLQAGSNVVLFAMSGGKEFGRAGGVLHSIRKDKIRVVLNTEGFPYWLTGGGIGLNLEFDDRSYREMEAAQREAIRADRNRLAELREMLLGEAEPRFHKWDYRYDNAQLNRSQVSAVQRCLEAEDVAVIHGPPGTGKTTTLVYAIVEVLKRERQVMVCAASNTAVDLLALRCANQGLSVLRLGNPARVDEDIHQLTLDESIARHPDYESLRRLRKEIEDLWRRAGKESRRDSGEDYRRRRELTQEARDFGRYAETLEDYILNQVLDGAQVIACTLSGAGHRHIASRKFHTLFIDEAAQALTPACWIAISRAGRVVFAGDHCQLPPTVKSFEAEKGGLGRTLMEAVVEKKGVAVMLDVQYRMNRAIMQFSSEKFYHGALHAAPQVSNWTLGPDIAPLEFVDTAGCGYEEKKDGSLSTSNPDEALLLLRHLAVLLNRLEDEKPGLAASNLSIGIIAPYKAQVKTLRELLAASPMLSSYEHLISVNTVDGFQGQERDLIYISLTRSNDRGEIGFLGDARRMNVALTRARKKLVVVGDSATLGGHAFFAGLLQHFETNGAYESAWSFAEAEA